MVISEGAINNIMGGMENTAGVRLHSHRHKLKQRFDILRKLGQGTYGKVQLAINKETGQEVAIKTIKKAKIETEQDLVRIRREIQIMSSVQHPQIIHIYEVFENREKMVLVMEYAAGGELYDYLSERKVLAEEEARRVFRQVASAVYYCHKHKICHRDLKLENILLDLDGNAKIADFGLSNVFDEKHRLDTFCGSPLYASPEIVKGIPYLGPEVDCWSLGVLLYTLVYGAMPFDGSNFRRLVKQITQGDFYEPATPATASELIRHMLTVKASDRATVEDICSHWWVNKGYKTSCLTEAEMLASQTPVRLDLLLSLAPKHIDSEHMLIQANGEAEMDRSEADTAEQRAADQNTEVPPRSHSMGAVPPDSNTDIEAFVEKKRRERVESDKKKKSEDGERKKKKSSSKKSSSKVKEEGETKEKKSKSSKDSSMVSVDEKPKKGDSSAERIGRSVDPEKKKKKRDVSTSSERKSEKKKSTKKKEKTEESVDTEKDLPTEDKQPSSVQESPNRASKEKDVSTKPKVKTPPKDVETTNEPIHLKSNSQEIEQKDKIEVPNKEELDSMDTEKILQETAAKIEAVEAAMINEGKNTNVDTTSQNESATGSVSSNKGSQNSSVVTSPIRSRTGSESSNEAGRQSRRQSKIFSKAAMFDNLAAQQSKSPPPDKSRRSSRTGGLNLSDITKKFEEKANVGKERRIVSPVKVSDAKRVFESKSATASRNSGHSTPTNKSASSSKRGSISSEEATNEKAEVPVKSESSPKDELIKSPKAIDKVVDATIKDKKTDVPKTQESVPKSTSRTIKIKMESEESSESESEAEKMLKTLTQKREKLEKAKAEKLKSVEPPKPSKTPQQQPPKNMSSSQEENCNDDTKFASLPRGFKNRESVSSSGSQINNAGSERPRIHLKINIITKPNANQSYSQSSVNKEVPVSSPSVSSRDSQPEQPKPRVDNEPRATFHAPGEPHLQRARRERIIPIMMEEEDDETISESSAQTNRHTNENSSMPEVHKDSVDKISDETPKTSHMSPEPIRKSRRERIIPIAIEGEGDVTPSTASTGVNRPIFQRLPSQPKEKKSDDNLARPPIPNQSKQGPRRPQRNSSRGRGFVDRSESFSSAGEDDDDDEDGFQILTAESLFSTLLNRVRHLTRKMDDTRSDRFRRQFGTDQMMSPGFWPNMEPQSRMMSGNLSREDNHPFMHFGSTFWNRGLSREPSDSDSVFSESSSSTLPRAGLLHRSQFPPSHLFKDPFFDLRRS